MSRITDKQVNEFWNSSIKTSDAASMLRHNIGKNEKPYSQIVKKLNNRCVDRWEKEVLRNISKNGVLPAMRVWPSWSTFIEGFHLKSAFENIKMLPRLTEEQLNFWLNTFKEKSVSELYKFGTPMLAWAWTAVENELRIRMSEEKWEKIYTDENGNYIDDPMVWSKNGWHHKDVAENKKLPFWGEDAYRDAHEKVSFILSTQVTPDE